MCFISKIKSKNMKESLINELWVNEMQEELVQLGINKVWKLVSRLNYA